MLNLSRREGESIILDLPDGRRIEIHVRAFRTRGGRPEVSLGIVAPLSIPIWRRELLEPTTTQAEVK